MLLYYLGAKLIFCCGLPGDAKLPKEKIRDLKVPVCRSDTAPQWTVTIGAPPRRLYGTVHSGNAIFYPTQRPELEFRCFAPPPVGNQAAG